MELIDISSAQSGLDMAAVKAAGKGGVFIKTTEGQDWTYNFSAFESGARNNGLIVGKYHWGRPDTNTSTSDARQITTDARLEAQWFLATAKPVEGDMVAIDWEQSGVSLSPAQMELWLATWLQTVEVALGQIPLVYTNPNYWQTMMGNSADFGAYYLWLASWGINDGQLHPASPLPGWSQVAIQQYTNKGVIPGWTGNVDLDYIDPKYEYTQLQLGQQPVVQGDPYGAPYQVVDGSNVVIATSPNRTTAFTDTLYATVGQKGRASLVGTRRTA